MAPCIMQHAQAWRGQAWAWCARFGRKHLKRHLGAGPAWYSQQEGHISCGGSVMATHICKARCSHHRTAYVRTLGQTARHGRIHKPKWRQQKRCHQHPASGTVQSHAGIPHVHYTAVVAPAAADAVPSQMAAAGMWAATGAGAAAAGAGAGAEEGAAMPVRLGRAGVAGPEHQPGQGGVAAAAAAAPLQHIAAAAEENAADSDGDEWHISTPPRSNTLRHTVSSDAEAPAPRPVMEQRPRRYSSSSASSCGVPQPTQVDSRHIGQEENPSQPTQLESQHMGHEEKPSQLSSCGIAGLLDMPWGLEQLVGQLTQGMCVSQGELAQADSAEVTQGMRVSQGELAQADSTEVTLQEAPAAPLVQQQQQRRRRHQLLDVQPGAPVAPRAGEECTIQAFGVHQDVVPDVGQGTAQSVQQGCALGMSSGTAYGDEQAGNRGLINRRRLAVGLDLSTLPAQYAPDDLTAPSEATTVARNSQQSDVGHHSTGSQGRTQAMRSSSTCPNLQDAATTGAEQISCFKPMPPKMPHAPSSPSSPKPPPGLMLRRAATCVPQAAGQLSVPNELASHIGSPKAPLSPTPAHAIQMQAGLAAVLEQQLATANHNSRRGLYVELPPITLPNTEPLNPHKPVTLVEGTSDDDSVMLVVQSVAGSSAWHPADGPLEAPRALLQTPGLAGSFRNRSSVGFSDTTPLRRYLSSRGLGIARGGGGGCGGGGGGGGGGREGGGGAVAQPESSGQRESKGGMSSLEPWSHVQNSTELLSVKPEQVTRLKSMRTSRAVSCTLTSSGGGEAECSPQQATLEGCTAAVDGSAISKVVHEPHPPLPRQPSTLPLIRVASQHSTH